MTMTTTDVTTIAPKTALDRPLELTGSAGGTYVCAPDSHDAEHRCVDAVDFCRTLAGRTPATGLLTAIVPF
jgi:hypothetical protein